MPEPTLDLCALAPRPSRRALRAPAARRLPMSAPQPSAIEERRRAPSRTPAALRDLDERREHRDPRRRDRHRRHARSSRRWRAPRSPRRSRRRPPTPSAEPIVFPDDVPAAANGAEPCTTVTVMSSFENAEMVANLAAGYNAPAPRHQRHVRHHRARARQVRRRRRGRRGRLPRPRARAAARPSGCPTRTPGSRSPARTARASVPADGQSVGSSNIVLAMPAPARRVDRLGRPSRRPGATSSTPRPTPTCGATSATPSGARSSSARRARWSRHPARRRCSRPSAPPQAIARRPHRGGGRGPVRAGRPCASTSSPRATTWRRPSTSSGTRVRPTRRARPRTSSRRSSSTRSRCGTTTAASRAATA